jgi:hypothetical protein
MLSPTAAAECICRQGRHGAHKRFIKLSLRSFISLYMVLYTPAHLSDVVAR